MNKILLGLLISFSFIQISFARYCYQANNNFLPTVGCFNIAPQPNQGAGSLPNLPNLHINYNFDQFGQQNLVINFPCDSGNDKSYSLQIAPNNMYKPIPINGKLSCVNINGALTWVLSNTVNNVMFEGVADSTDPVVHYTAKTNTSILYPMISWME